MTTLRNWQTFRDVLRDRADRDGAATALTFLTDWNRAADQASYAELDRRARAIAARLQAVCGRDERALLLYPPGLDYVAALFGCFYAGVIAVPAYPPDPLRLNRTLPRLLQIVRDADATVALTIAAVLPMTEAALAQAPELQRLRWIASDGASDGVEDAWRDPGGGADSIAFLQYTSGSTTSPRGVVLTHGNLLANSRFSQRGFALSTGSRGLSWLPPYHDMGLIGGILQPLFVGFPGILMSPLAFLERPARWLRAITEHRITASVAPNFAYELCVRRVKPDELPALDLSSWSLAATGAEPIRAATMERFCSKFAGCGFRRRAFVPCYGLAEATLAVTIHRAGDYRSGTFASAALEQRDVVETRAGDAATVLVSSGRTDDDVEVVIVDPDTGAPCGGDRIGEIWIRGSSVAHGYWNRAEDSERVFHATLADGRGGFLRSGDLGFLRDGELYVTGRLKDLLIIQGRNLYPQDVEAEVEASHPAVRASCCAAFTVEHEGTGQLVVMCEVDTRHDVVWTDVIWAIRQRLARTIDARVHAVSLLPPRTIPKTSSGKIQRWLCRAGFLDGSLAEVARHVSIPARGGDEGELPVVTSAERHRLLVELNATARDYDLTTPVSARIAAVAARSPQALAAASDVGLTYQELVAWSRQITRALRAAGVMDGDLVPLMLRRGISLLPAMLGVLDAGAAFVPIDVNWPAERIRTALARIAPRAIVVDQACAGLEAIAGRVTIVTEQTRQASGSPAPSAAPAPEAPVYGYFTSGSTGEPKLALVCHRGLANRFAWMDELFGAAPPVTLQTTPHVFDSAVWQLLWPLTRGGRAVVPSDSPVLTADEVTTLIERHGITVVDFVPSVLAGIMPQLARDSGLAGRLRSLRHVIVGGEALPPGTLHALRAALPEVQILNLYGPTETTIGCVAAVLGGDEDVVPIGRPIANVRVAVLDDDRRLVPLGTAGELYLTGACLGLGYFADDAATARAFVANPYPELAATTLYRTGDLVRYRADGTLDFLGRLDHQVKIRGLRIELGEIEAVLLRHPGVTACVVVAREDTPGDKRLVAYVTGAGPIDEAELRARAQAALPAYMVPAAFEVLDALPLTASGKVDRKALPPPAHRRDATDRAFVAPRTPIESRLASIWSDLLHADRVGVHDDFFELGGDSLLSLEVVARSAELGLHLTPQQIFERPTIALLAAAVA